MEENHLGIINLPNGAMSLIFWGMILEFIDFKINGFDILPDILGAIIVIVGLSRLVEINIFFRKAKTFWLIGLTFIIVEEIVFVLLDTQFLFVLFRVLAIVVGLIGLYFLCKGISEFANEVEND